MLDRVITFVIRLKKRRPVKMLARNRTIFSLPVVQALGQTIYKVKSRTQPRSQSTTTGFYRNLGQLSALNGPLSHLVSNGPIRVLVVGCSMGCEAYTLAGFLAAFCPTLDWCIEAIDISEEALAVARAGHYGTEHGLGRDYSEKTAAIEAKLFSIEGARWSILPDVSDRVDFTQGDILLDMPRYKGSYDLVFGQNFMIHMVPSDEAKAFKNLVDAVRPGGALFIGGMDLDARKLLVGQHQLSPVEWKLREIHEEDYARRNAWPWEYWSLEPFPSRSDALAERYATIFTKPSAQVDAIIAGT